MKKTMKKRIICFMLTLALLISLVPAQSAFAASDSYGVSGQYKITDISSKKKTITIVSDGMIVDDLYHYQIQISKDKKFKKSVKTYTEKGFTLSYDESKRTKKTSKNMKITVTYGEQGQPYATVKISKMKKGTYYVRLRGSNGTGHYTKWSKAKKIKVK